MFAPATLSACLLAAVALLGGCGSSGDDEVILATYDFHNAGSGFGSVASHVELRLSFSDDPPYEMLTITPPLAGGESGVSYETRPGDSATAASVLGRLANGNDELLGLLGWWLPVGGGGGGTADESSFYDTRHPDLTGVDLVGATVTRVIVRIDSCTFVPGDPHSRDIAGTLIVMGTLD